MELFGSYPILSYLCIRNPARVRYTEAQASARGLYFIFNRYHLLRLSNKQLQSILFTCLSHLHKSLLHLQVNAIMSCG